MYRCSAEGVVAMFNLVVMEPLTTASEEPAYDVIMTAHAVYICHCKAYIMPLQVDFLFPIAQLGHAVHSLLNIECTDLMRMVKAAPIMPIWQSWIDYLVTNFN